MLVVFMVTTRAQKPTGTNPQLNGQLMRSAAMHAQSDQNAKALLLVPAPVCYTKYLRK